MKFSEAWVREWVNPDIDTDTLVAQLTMAGLEVDGVEQVAGDFDGVVVAEIISTEQHPNADKLRVCTVNSGAEELQIVCGAPNARSGIRVPLAKVGAVLPGDFKIKKAKLRDVESFGMLCAREELGVSGDSSGLWELPADAPIGDSLSDYLALDDKIIEVDLTPNRADCLSIRGVAREVGVLNNSPVDELEIKAIAAQSDDVFNVALESPQDCPNYLGRVIKNVNVNAETPLWMQSKLERSEIGSISPVVDVTNYVLLELGQPMHAFDLNTLSGGIRVRKAGQGEKLTLLDKREVELNPEVLVIADHKKAVAMAGIMGGLETSVTNQTQDIFLESAFFNPLSITGKAREFGLHTDSSHRFERGVDYELQEKAIERATQLLIDICGGTPGPVIAATSETDIPANQSVRLRKSRLERLIGASFETDQVTEILQRLGMKVENQDDAGWTLTGPGWRFDIQIEADLIEEIARVYGYDRLPERTPSCSQSLVNVTESRLNARRPADHLVSNGFREVINYSFIDPAVQEACVGDVPAIHVENPIASDMSVMRTSLLPGLLKTVEHNLKRQRTDLRLFEEGLCFIPATSPATTENLNQVNRIAGVMVGSRLPESWANTKEKVDFYDIKHEVEQLCNLAIDSCLEFASESGMSLYHPGQSALVTKDGQSIGYLGAVHPAVLKALDIDQRVYAFELEQDAILDTRVPDFEPLSKFPEVRRDIAIIVDRELPASALVNTAKQASGELLSNARIFDIYEGQGIDSNKKSVGIGLTFRDYSRTLNDEDVTSLVEKILALLASEFGAVQR